MVETPAPLVVTMISRVRPGVHVPAQQAAYLLGALWVKQPHLLG